MWYLDWWQCSTISPIWRCLYFMNDIKRVSKHVLLSWITYRICVDICCLSPSVFPSWLTFSIFPPPAQFSSDCTVSECTVQPSVHNYCIFVLLCRVLHDLKISLGFLISISILTFKKMLNWEPGNVSHCADWLCLCRSWYLLSAFTRRCEVRLGSPETR